MASLTFEEPDENVEMKELEDSSTSVEPMRSFPSKEKCCNFKKIHLVALVAYVSSVSMGMTVGFSSVAIHDIIIDGTNLNITERDETWFFSLVPLGASFGGFGSGILISIFGRRGTLIISSLPFLAGWLTMAFAENKFMIIIGRVMTGLACGLVTVAVPLYTVEIATISKRGIFGAGSHFFYTIGILLSVLLGLVAHWTVFALVSCIIPAIGLISISLMPETPSWLVSQGRQLEAAQAVIYLLGANSSDTEEECAIIIENLREDARRTVTRSLMKDALIYKPALLSIMLVFFQQLTGVNIILFYAPLILTRCNTILNSHILFLIVALVLSISAFIAMLVFDKCDRKRFLIVSGIGCSVSLAGLGAFIVEVQMTTSISSWIPLLCLCLFVMFYCLGYGPIPYFMFAEMVPIRARGIIGGLAAGFNWAMAFAVIKTFELFKQNMDDYGVYFFYSGMGFLGMIILAFFLPETRFKKLTEVQRHFQNPTIVQLFNAKNSGSRISLTGYSDFD